ncbi:MAG: YbaN family protein [Chthonomonas sp.]|nr:YbaN family protein [Chthonomonas sp.]
MLNRLSRTTYLALGFLCVALGIIGYFVPVMPGTIFLILAVGAFGKSDPRLEAKLLNHPRFGPTLRDWKETKSIRLRTKWLATAVIIPTFVLSVLAISRPWAQVVVGLTGVWLLWYLWSRKTKLNGNFELGIRNGDDVNAELESRAAS